MCGIQTFRKATLSRQVTWYCCRPNPPSFCLRAWLSARAVRAAADGIGGPTFEPEGGEHHCMDPYITVYAPVTRHRRGSGNNPVYAYMPAP